MIQKMIVIMNRIAKRCLMLYSTGLDYSNPKKLTKRSIEHQSIEDMLRVVSKNGNRFISECSKWVKEFCPLDARDWVRMDKDAKKRLFDKIQRISEKNWSNRLSQKITPSNGAKSAARIYHDKVHKDGKWDPKGEVKYDEFKKLDEDQIQKRGINNLSLKEAYVEVLKEKPGYHRGLGPRPVPPKKGRNEGESNQIRVELTAQLQQLQQKEAALQGELGELKATNLELKTNIEHMQKEAVKRENKWKQEAIKRENNIREELFDLIRLYIPQ
ncbi:hypothetical protein Cgig2_008553 [Carnegiea gigantea]|uniref:Uncharacterized protein n=1 Tax=Carnegiea gigantea TaxID=171969 RepID=A0A9Q1GZ22_9CARY|nr:hypothetical protein Cgig2_008553 [Carnegiea gigantea]